MTDKSSVRTFDPRSIDHDFSQNYKILIGSLLPRPIAWVSTKNVDGTFNIAPFSFFTAVSASPMIIAFSPMARSSDGNKKDTLINIEREREFVVNFVTESNMDLANMTSTELPYGQSEFDLANLNVLPGTKVSAPRCAESPIHFECQLRDILYYGSGPGSGTLITGEVIQVHLQEKIMKDGKIQTQEFKPVGRGAGNDWFLCDHVIVRERLMKKQIQK